MTLPRLDLAKGLEIVLFADDSWANATHNRTQGGHIIFLAEKDQPTNKVCKGALVHWNSSSLTRVCTSISHAETLSLLRGVDDSLVVAHFVQELLHGRQPNLLERAVLFWFL